MANHKNFDRHDEDEDEDAYFGQFRPLRTKGFDQKEKRKVRINDYWDYED